MDRSINPNNPNDIIISEGPLLNVEGTEDEKFQQLVESVDDVQKALAGLNANSAAGMAQQADELLRQMRATPEAARQAAEDTRDVENYIRSLGDKLGQNRDQFLQALEGKLQHLTTLGGQRLDDAAGTLTGHINKAANPYSSGLSGLAQDTFHSAGATMMISNFSGALMNSVKSLTQFVGSSLGISTAFTGLATAAAGAVVAFGIFESLSALRGQEDYEMAILAGSPGSAGSLLESQGEVGSVMTMRNDLQRNLLSVRSDQDADRLMKTAFKLRPRPDQNVSMQDMEGMAYTFGALEDHGVSADTSLKTSMGMTKELRMSFGQARAGMMQLANTAVSNGYDISQYMDRAVTLTKSLKGYGTTLFQVDKVFQNWSNSMLGSGGKMTFEGAMQATEMQMNLRRSLTEGEAAYIAMTSGSGLHAETSDVFHGSSSSLGQLAQQGPAGMKLASAYMRMGNTPGASDATIAYHRNRVNQQMGMQDTKGLSGDDKNNLKYYFMANELGVGDKFGMPGQEGVSQFVRKMADGAVLTEKEYKTGMQEIVANPIDAMATSLSDKYPAIYNKMYNELVGHNRSMSSLRDVWSDIKRLLISAFLPGLEVSASATVALGTYFQTQDASAAGAAYDKSMGYYKDLNTRAFGEFFEGDQGGFARALGLYGEEGDAHTAAERHNENQSLAMRTALDNGVDPLMFSNLLKGMTNLDPNYSKGGIGSVSAGMESTLESLTGKNWNPSNTRDNLDLSANYFKLLKQRFQKAGFSDSESTEYAIASYHSGYDSVRSKLAAGEDLNTDTTSFVKKILNQTNSAKGLSGSSSDHWYRDTFKKGSHFHSHVVIDLSKDTKPVIAKKPKRTVPAKTINTGTGKK